MQPYNPPPYQVPQAPPPKPKRSPLPIVLAFVAAILVLCCLPTAAFVGYAIVSDSGSDSDSPVASAPETPDTGDTPQAPGQTPTGRGEPVTSCAWKPATGGNPADVKDVGLPPTQVDSSKATTVRIVTDGGPIEMTVDRRLTPCTIASLEHLAGKGYFDGTSCHRLTTDGIWVLQCGDPTGTGRGGPSYQFGEENLASAKNPYPRGVVAMANAGPGTNGSQFFIVYKDSPIPANYTQFGTITTGLAVVDRIAEGGVNGGAGSDGPPARPVKINSVSVTR